jgi:hypothetical protein
VRIPTLKPLQADDFLSLEVRTVPQSTGLPCSSPHTFLILPHATTHRIRPEGLRQEETLQSIDQYISSTIHTTSYPSAALCHALATKIPFHDHRHSPDFTAPMARVGKFGSTSPLSSLPRISHALSPKALSPARYPNSVPLGATPPLHHSPSNQVA